MGVFATHLQELAQQCGAIAFQGQATAGGASTLDDTSLVQDDDHWNNHRIYIYEGTGIGQERQITDFAAATDRITVTPAWATVPDTDSKYVILHYEWTVDELRNAWKLALRQQRRNLLLPKVDSSTITLSVTSSITYAYNVPTGFYAIQHMLRESEAGSGQFTYELDDDWWYFNRGLSPVQIVFDKLWNDARQFIVNGCALRIIGQQVETEPADDEDTLSVPTGQLIMLAASLALEAQSIRAQRPENYRLMANRYRSLFDPTADRMRLLPGSKVVSEAP